MKNIKRRKRSKNVKKRKKRKKQEKEKERDKYGEKLVRGVWRVQSMYQE